jgi:hypothetical protein
MVPMAGHPAARYDIRAAVHTIPEYVPFVPHERRPLLRQRKPEQFQWEYVRGNRSNVLPLIDRWYDWLWEPDRRASSPSEIGQELAEARVRLNVSVDEVLAGQTR